jgi:hypothetical protein
LEDWQVGWQDLQPFIQKQKQLRRFALHRRRHQPEHNPYGNACSAVKAHLLLHTCLYNWRSWYTRPEVALLIA